MEYDRTSSEGDGTLTVTRPSICRLCTAHCPILVTIEDGRAVKVTGDPQGPLFGGYTCAKGRALPEQHAQPERLLHSQKRSPDGGYGPIRSGRAMDEIADRLEDLIARHGPRSIAMYIGTNALPYPASGGMASALLRAIGSRLFFTANTIDQPGKQIAAALHGAWKGGYPPFEGADTWLLVGTNPVISKAGGIGPNPAQRLKLAARGGLKLIVIDPRRTETARYAHIHLQSRPGEDPSLLAALLHVILAEGLYDKHFIEENVAGIELLARAVEPFTPERVAKRADVPAAQIVEAARVFAGADRGGVTTGTGPSFATRGTLTTYLSLCLNSLCGKWPRAGERLRKPNVLLQGYTARAEPYPPYPPCGFGEKLRVRGLANSVSGLPTAGLAEEILLDGPGQVRALICIGSNPMMAWPDQHRTFAAMKKLDLLVTLDTEMSATSRLAHYVIAPRMTFETPGMTQQAEGLKYFGAGLGFEEPYAQYTTQLIDPPPGSDLIEDWELFYGLARRMGLLLQWVNFFGSGKHLESPTHVQPIDMESKPTTDEIFELMCANSRVPLAEVKRHPHGHVFEEVNELIQPREKNCEHRLDVASPQMLGELAEVRSDVEHAIDSEYPYLLIPRRLDRFMNSSGRTNRRLSGSKPFNPAYLHPDELERLGLRSGDRVTVRSTHAMIHGVVEADATLRGDVVSMSHAFGVNPDEDDDPREVGGNTGRLMRVDDAFDPITGIPRMGALPVAIEATRDPAS